MALAEKQLVNTDGKRKALEKNMLRLDRVQLNGTRKCDRDDVDAHSFLDWIRFAKQLKDPDAIRNCLYYGFQPLNDRLISGDIDNIFRPLAVNALNGIIDTSTQFLMSYYTGKPDITVFNDGIKQIEPNIAALGSTVLYSKKYRNIDYNGIYPNDVLSFLRRFLGYVIDNKICIPDYVIGCACGASEIAISLAGVLETDVGFLRKSKRRNDERVLVVREQGPIIQERAANRNVVCVEDYACTSESLGYIMEKAASYRASSVLGTSINFSHEGNYVQNFVNDYKFNLFKLRTYPWRKI